MANKGVKEFIKQDMYAAFERAVNWLRGHGATQDFKAAAVGHSALDTVSFQQILPDRAHAQFHDQLQRMEAVHPAPLKEILKKRIGEEDANKRCFARVLHGEGGQSVTAGIFTALYDITEQQGQNWYRALPGDTAAVKDTPVQPFDVQGAGQKAVAILYTISSNRAHQRDDRGAGRKLAAEVHAHLHAEARERGYDLTVSTLSPVRGFAEHFSEDAEELVSGAFDEKEMASDEWLGFLDDHANQEMLKEKVMTYLLTQKDPVMNFHLGNGAYIGDININPYERQDWATINYVYPDKPEHVKANARAYDATKVRPIAPHLIACITSDAEVESNSQFKVVHAPNMTAKSVPAVKQVDISVEHEG